MELRHLVAALLAGGVGLTLGAAAYGVEPDWAAVEEVFGRPAKLQPDGVRKFGWPRSDLHVIRGEVALEPALALGSWAAFHETSAGAIMAMGDLVLLEGEVNPVVGALQSGGFEVTAIHNHLVGETPHVMYLHFAARGNPRAVAGALKAALQRTATPLTPAPAPETTPPEAALLQRVEQALGRKGSTVGRVLQVSVPRAQRVREDGMEVPDSMGMATALNFQAMPERVAATGDFVLVAAEVNPVIGELRSHGIEVTALHSHMLTETPRLFFLHFWAVGKPEDLGAGLKAALDRVATK